MLWGLSLAPLGAGVEAAALWGLSLAPLGAGAEAAALWGLIRVRESRLCYNAVCSVTAGLLSWRAFRLQGDGPSVPRARTVLAPLLSES